MYTSWLAYRKSEQSLLAVIRGRGWKYFLLAVVDVEANYLMVKAYHYTTVTSVQVGRRVCMGPVFTLSTLDWFCVL